MNCVCNCLAVRSCMRSLIVNCPPHGLDWLSHMGKCQFMLQCLQCQARGRWCRPKWHEGRRVVVVNERHGLLSSVGRDHPRSMISLVQSHDHQGSPGVEDGKDLLKR